MAETPPQDPVWAAVEAGHLAAADAARLRTELSLSDSELRSRLLELACAGADPPVSRFRVGAVAQARDGSYHLGANFEFGGNPLSVTVHAEQAAVSQAWLAGALGVDVVQVSEVPCGHCRQFLLELGMPSLGIEVRGRSPWTLAELIPEPFGPGALGVSASLWDHATARRGAAGTGEVVSAARQMAEVSYVPYSRVPSGVALELDDATIIVGGTIESAAFNPSLGALRSAWVNLVFSGKTAAEVVRAVFAEGPGSAGRYGDAARMWATQSSVRLEHVVA